MSLRTLAAASLLAFIAPQPVLAQSSSAPTLPAECRTFTWDVANELALLATQPSPIHASAGGAETPANIALGTFYRVTLKPQAAVTLAAKPGKPTLEDDASAGLLTFRVPADGRYRVAITSRHWIDVVDRGQVVASLDFQGHRGCPLVHKIVEFQLSAGRDLMLQYSRAHDLVSGVLITPMPATTAGQ